MQHLPIHMFYQRGKNIKYKHGYCKMCHKSKAAHQRISCPHCGCWIKITGIDEQGKQVKSRKRAITIKESKKRYKDVTQKPVKDFLK